jgi:hypothetical protein
MSPTLASVIGGGCGLGILVAFVIGLCRAAAAGDRMDRRPFDWAWEDVFADDPVGAPRRLIPRMRGGSDLATGHVCRWEASR